MPTLEIDFEVWCECGEGLCNQTTVKGDSITIRPCNVCYDKAYEEGHSKGYDEGYVVGKDEGYHEGFEASQKEA